MLVEDRSLNPRCVMRGFLQATAVAAVLVTCGQVWADESTSSPIGRKIDNLSLPDHHGKVRELAELRGERLLVVAFLGVECPLAKIYAPRLVSLAADYDAKGVKFVAIDSNLQDSLTDIATFARAHNLSFPLLKDMNNRVADAFGATRTPEVFVLDAQNAIRYAGRIDDQY